MPMRSNKTSDLGLCQKNNCFIKAHVSNMNTEQVILALILAMFVILNIKLVAWFITWVIV